MKRYLYEAIDKTGEFSSSDAYLEYTRLAEYVAETLESMRLTDSMSDFPEEFFDNVEMYIRYGNFRKLGKGSSRTAYSFDADDRYVLKFAHNANGLKQNRSEIKNAKIGSGDYDCTVRILEYSPDGVLIVEDLCKQSSYEDWNRIIGLSPNMLSKIVRTVFEKRETDSEYSLRDLRDELKETGDYAGIFRKTSAMDDHFRIGKDEKPVMTCIEGILGVWDGTNSEPKWVSLADMFRFYFDNGLGAMIPEELLFIDQWGVKAGATPAQDALVIIDPGVDEDFMPFVGQNGRVK